MIGVGTTIFLVNPATFPSTSYLLDTYSASAAYSLRQLKTGVTNVVRVRRSSDNAEQDFTASDITDGTLTTWVGGGNDGFVTVWYDQSGGANDVSQATAGQQPQIVSAGSLITFASRNSISFTSALRYLSLGSGLTAMNHTQNTSIFAAAINSSADIGAAIVTTVNNPSADGLKIRLDTDGTSNQMMIARNSGGTNYNVGASGNLTAGTNYLLSYFLDSSKNMSAFDNGNTGGTNTYTGTWTNNDMYIGANFALSQELTGAIAELIIFNSDQTANRTTIETDINAYYSIY